MFSKKNETYLNLKIIKMKTLFKVPKKMHKRNKNLFIKTLTIIKCVDNGTIIEKQCQINLCLNEKYILEKLLEKTIKICDCEIKNIRKYGKIFFEGNKKHHNIKKFKEIISDYEYLLLMKDLCIKTFKYKNCDDKEIIYFVSLE
jgi:hypothetical protein